MTTKYEPIHVTLYNSHLHELLERGLNPELLKTHSISGLVRLDEKQWIVRLEYSVLKEMNAVKASGDT